jgi:hypothetical protein
MPLVYSTYTKAELLKQALILAGFSHATGINFCMLPNSFLGHFYMEVKIKKQSAYHPYSQEIISIGL